MDKFMLLGRLIFGRPQWERFRDSAASWTNGYPCCLDSPRVVILDVLAPVRLFVNRPLSPVREESPADEAVRCCVVHASPSSTGESRTPHSESGPDDRNRGR